jgi:hypothetical protein
LGDLDERVWAELPRDAIEALADHVALVVGANRRKLMRAEERIFAGPVPVEMLRLSPRAENALLRHGIADGKVVYPVALHRLVTMRGVGGISLLQVLTAADALPELPTPDASSREIPLSSIPSSDRSPRTSRAVRREAAQLAKRRWARKLTRRDPRLGRELRELVPGAHDAYAAAQLLPAFDYEPSEARQTAAKIRALVARGDQMRRLTLPVELGQILMAVTRTEHQRSALIRRFGWDGLPPATLEEASQEIGVTRERVRQIEAKARKQFDSAWTPALDRALAMIAELRFTTAAEIQAALQEAKLVTDDFALSSLVRAARLFGREVPAITDRGGVVATADLAHAVTAIEGTARRLTDRWGTTTVAELASVLSEKGFDLGEDVARKGLDSVPHIRYLDEERNWFWFLGSTRNRLLNQIRKIVSVAGSIDISELRDGVGRHHRMRGFRPPRSVLARLCVDTGLYRVEEERVYGANDLPDWRDVLGTNERLLAEILFEHGPVMRRTDLEELVVGDRGMSRNSFYVYLTYSPILQRYAPGVFGLRGATISAAEVSALIPHIVRSKVLSDQGWTTDGRPWVAYTLSPSAVASGVLSAPAALAPVLQGSFKLITSDDAPMGTLVVEETRMWGISPFYRRRGVDSGDTLALEFDVKARTARVHVGDEARAVQLQEDE